MVENEVTFKINPQLFKEFQRVVAMEEKVLGNVIEKIITNYINESNSTKVGSGVGIKVADPKYRKALIKIKLWKDKTWQNNHKILRAFWEIEEEIGMVTVDAMVKRCGNKDKFPDTYVEKFHANFEQMKTDSGNSNGKVFEVDYKNVVKIWDAVYEGITQYKDSFIRRK